MYLLEKRADKINGDDIKRLIEIYYKENKSLDYKKELNLNQDKDKKELLFDITVMYNTDGGCLIYGIEEAKDEKGQNTGTPKSVIGISVSNPDKLIQQIEDIVKGNTQPSISSLVFSVITVEDLCVLVIGIPKGIGLPVMVTFNEVNKFYKRRTTGKYSVDVHELNQMFLYNQVLAETIEKYRAERIEQVLSLKAFSNLNIYSSVLVQIIPFNFSSNQIDVSGFEVSQLHLMMPPMQNVNGWSQRFNHDGFATVYRLGSPSEIYGYDQIFRNGVYEAYTSLLFWQEETRNGKINCTDKTFVKKILKKIDQALMVLKKIDIQTPLIVCISLHNIKNGVIVGDRGPSNPFRVNEILLPAITLQGYDVNLYQQLKPTFDILWQSVGISSSPVQL